MPLLLRSPRSAVVSPPGDGETVGRETAALLPPHNFHPIRGQVKSAALVSNRDRKDEPTPSAARSAGRKFEAKVREVLRAALGGELWNFRPAQWFEFSDDGGFRRCQVDVLLEPKAKGLCPVIFEIKTARTSRAWWQLHELYRPVVSYIFQGRVLMCEIVGEYAAVSVPGPSPVFVSSLEDLRNWLLEPGYESYAVGVLRSLRA